MGRDGSNGGSGVGDTFRPCKRYCRNREQSGQNNVANQLAVNHLKLQLQSTRLFRALAHMTTNGRTMFPTFRHRNVVALAARRDGR